jgi:hypothetical protein
MQLHSSSAFLLGPKHRTGSLADFLNKRTAVQGFQWATAPVYVYISSGWASSHSDTDEEYGLLGCDALQFGENPPFRRNISLPSSGSKSKARKQPTRSKKRGILLVAWVTIRPSEAYVNCRTTRCHVWNGKPLKSSIKRLCRHRRGNPPNTGPVLILVLPTTLSLLLPSLGFI